uniref:Phosphatidylcholine transfer protein n=1 Tax=Megaselia scalaris TaxID=36166 RepID=T1GQP6_MEGSC
MYDSNTDRIALAIIEQFINEVELIEKLLTDSNSCKKCKSRIPSPIKRRHIRNNPGNNENDESEECSCSSKVAEIFTEKDDSWEPYLKREKENIVIWRKEHIPAMYAYKVYAQYDDITPNDFLHVQTDLEYRKQWDDTVAELEMIETDHFNDRSIIYWEIRWPRLFANRDYVYDRKIYTDEKKKWIVISNKSSTHEKCPVYGNKHRVKDYWSYMIIKPKTTFYEPGLQYILIYYDDPGLAIPSTVTSWVAQTQMPDFLYKLYIATKKFAEKKQKSMK